jgi:hypothetical protein
VKLFKLTPGRFPRKSGGDADETKLYYWMWACTDETRNMWTQERAGVEPPLWRPEDGNLRGSGRRRARRSEPGVVGARQGYPP